MTDTTQAPGRIAMAIERDVMVPTRDGSPIAVDIFRPMAPDQPTPTRRQPRLPDRRRRPRPRIRPGCMRLEGRLQGHVFQR